jgi:hypothetical protein
MRVALHSKYPTFTSTGYNAFENKTPRIYISGDYTALAEKFCFQFGFPRSSIKFIRVPYNSTCLLDLSLLEEAISDDIDNGSFSPLMVIAVVGK